MKEPSKSLRSLPAELLIQILHKLSIRYALRCALVCKEWRCLVSDPFFKSTFNPINQPLTLILIPPPPSSPLSAFSFEINGSDPAAQLVGQPWPLPCGFDTVPVRVVGSCNGLIALYKDVDDPLFCLFNPCTKEEKRVRVPPSDEYCHSFWGLSIDSVTGLCHDPASDEYKVVVTRCNSSPRFLLVRFNDDRIDDSFSIGTKTTHELIDDLCTPLVCSLGTTVEGSPHWISYRTGRIMYFDWQTEEYRTTQLPDCVEIDDWCWDDEGDWKVKMKPAPACGLGALDGRLTVALATRGGRCEVWALREYGDDDSWSLLFVMPVDRFRPFSLLSWMKDEWVVFIFDEDDQQELMIYDVVLRSFRRLQLNLRRTLFPNNNMVFYFPSLVSPNSR